jgi:hypothetical protein
MRLSWIAAAFFLGATLISCSRDERSGRNEPAARQAGRDAYHASREVKQGARRAAHELENAGKEFRQGWGEAKHDDKTDRRPYDRDRR